MPSELQERPPPLATPKPPAPVFQKSRINPVFGCSVSLRIGLLLQLNDFEMLIYSIFSDSRSLEGLSQ